MTILVNGEPEHDEQGFLIRQLVSSKQRWYKDKPEFFLEWMKGLRDWLSRGIVELEASPEDKGDE